MAVSYTTPVDRELQSLGLGDIHIEMDNQNEQAPSTPGKLSGEQAFETQASGFLIHGWKFHQITCILLFYSP